MQPSFSRLLIKVIISSCAPRTIISSLLSFLLLFLRFVACVHHCCSLVYVLFVVILFSCKNRSASPIRSDQIRDILLRISYCYIYTPIEMCLRLGTLCPAFSHPRVGTYLNPFYSFHSFLTLTYSTALSFSKPLQRFAVEIEKSKM